MSYTLEDIISNSTVVPDTYVRTYLLRSVATFILNTHINKRRSPGKIILSIWFFSSGIFERGDFLGRSFFPVLSIFREHRRARARRKMSCLSGCSMTIIVI